ncbi:hypothetical protein GCM10011348_46120 [Marinobacterium nitratireducens]|uniref:Uncharacterized protein n=1 Tax=Marinobacterium nitratireducens TaxID=518897 RepID=A0A918DZ20_9GAMM|nr:hypothetical protein [Marinobacterium nitratireducens]GGO89118.1 hypothetical protein GCM10011348_46120 [Marinobacterium nitratireducens]
MDIRTEIKVPVEDFPLIIGLRAGGMSWDEIADKWEVDRKYLLTRLRRAGIDTATAGMPNMPEIKLRSLQNNPGEVDTAHLILPYGRTPLVVMPINEYVKLAGEAV